LVGRQTEIKVTTLFPGFIASAMTDQLRTGTPLMVDTETGVRAMVAAIEKEVDQASVPQWPWLPVGLAMRYLPRPLARRLF
jgi:short-subunit dehydrogenase